MRKSQVGILRDESRTRAIDIEIGVSTVNTMKGNPRKTNPKLDEKIKYNGMLGKQK